MGAGTAEIALELTGIDLSLAGAAVLRGLSIAVRRGELMGLCAEEEAAKSAALLVASGAYAAHEYDGEVRVAGELVQFRGPACARKLGIYAIHRDSLSAPELTVAEHLLFGREPTRFGLVDGVRTESAARALLADFGCTTWIDPRARMHELSPAKCRLIELLRCLSCEPKVLLLDEPSALLGPREHALFERWLVAAAERGTAVLYASRRIDDLFELSDRITVLRHGRTAARFETREAAPENVVSVMLGRELRGLSRSVTAS